MKFHTWKCELINYWLEEDLVFVYIIIQCTTKAMKYKYNGMIWYSTVVVKCIFFSRIQNCVHYKCPFAWILWLSRTVIKSQIFCFNEDLYAENFNRRSSWIARKCQRHVHYTTWKMNKIELGDKSTDAVKCSHKPRFRCQN